MDPFLFGIPVSNVPGGFDDMLGIPKPEKSASPNDLVDSQAFANTLRRGAAASAFSGIGSTLGLGLGKRRRTSSRTGTRKRTRREQPHVCIDKRTGRHKPCDEIK